MRIAVIGAGIVGVTTAYELASDGHEVTVLERRASVASEASFANAGVMATHDLAPWSVPTSKWRLLSQRLSRQPELRLNLGLDRGRWAWAWRWWRAASTPTAKANLQTLLQLANYSRERLHALSDKLQLDYEAAQGSLVLLKNESDLRLAQSSLDLLQALELPSQMLDPAQCLALEPGLNPNMALHGGIHFPQDDVANCRQFTVLLRAAAQLRGAKFEFHQTVLSIAGGSSPRITTVSGPTSDSVFTTASRTPSDPATLIEPAPEPPQTRHFDAIVVCAALGAPELLAPLGLRLPLAPVHGHSITLPLRQVEGHPDLGPRAAVIDRSRQVSITRLGARVRVSGGAEMGSPTPARNKATLDSLYASLQEWFPGAARTSQAQRWSGARPSLPEGLPVIGAGPQAGVWLNLGHGASGWALACGSARLLADTISRQLPALPVDRLSAARYAG